MTTETDGLRALEACPFCGGSDLHVETYDVQPDDYHSGYVTCGDCDCQGAKPDTWLDNKVEAESAAIQTWNARALTAPSVGALSEAQYDGVRDLIRQAYLQGRTDNQFCAGDEDRLSYEHTALATEDLLKLFPCATPSPKPDVTGELVEALEPFCFFSDPDANEGEEDTVQSAWEIRYRDRFKDWICFKDIERAREVFALLSRARGE